ncbi:MAG: (d)CMP kinase [Clostridiales bacterium]|nr:(d)CMP kinase [Candidatus Scatonaster coprocaballi]
MEYYQIAVDGPSGSGKSTLAKGVAAKLGILYLDTGAMYRACGLKAMKSGIDTKDQVAVEQMMQDIKIDITHENGEQHVWLDGEDVSKEIRMPGVSVAASDVSAMPFVREAMVSLQRKISEGKNVILDGRDIGSKVFPNAKYKFFLVADAKERAKRRLAELKEKGATDVTFEEVLHDIEYRDQQDATRAASPLVKVEDAIEIDTTSISIEGTLEALLSYIHE